MARVALEQAYPGLEFRPKTRNWWARLVGQPAECVHLETQYEWMATFIPDKVYLRGKGREVRETVRPEVSLCRACLLDVAQPELAEYDGRVVAFEPDAEKFSQYFFVATPDFQEAGLLPEVGDAIAVRLGGITGTCEKERCEREAAWVWFSREEVSSLDDVSRIERATGRRLCAGHGAAKFRLAMDEIADANIFYVNLPYGEAGAYVWI